MVLAIGPHCTAIPISDDAKNSNFLKYLGKQSNLKSFKKPSRMLRMT